MSVLHLATTNFRDLRYTLLRKAIDHPAFREDLADALQATAGTKQDLSIEQITIKVTSFVKGLLRANRIAFANHYDKEYRGGHPPQDGGTVRNAAWMMDALEHIEYNTRLALPSGRGDRFELDGWGGAPEHALRIHHPVGMAVVELWTETEKHDPVSV